VKEEGMHRWKWISEKGAIEIDPDPKKGTKEKEEKNFL
jgi:hypothetical protein